MCVCSKRLLHLLSLLSNRKQHHNRLFVHYKQLHNALCRSPHNKHHHKYHHNKQLYLYFDLRRTDNVSIQPLVIPTSFFWCAITAKVIFKRIKLTAIIHILFAAQTNALRSFAIFILPILAIFTPCYFY